VRGRADEQPAQRAHLVGERIDLADRLQPAGHQPLRVEREERRAEDHDDRRGQQLDWIGGQRHAEQCGQHHDHDALDRAWASSGRRIMPPEEVLTGRPAGRLGQAHGGQRGGGVVSILIVVVFPAPLGPGAAGQGGAGPAG